MSPPAMVCYYAIAHALFVRTGIQSDPQLLDSEFAREDAGASE